LTELQLSLGSAAASRASAGCGSPFAASSNFLRLIRTALIAEYPFLEPEDLQQALRYAAATVDDERLTVDRVA